MKWRCRRPSAAASIGSVSNEKGNSNMKIPSYMRPKYPVLLVAGLGGLFTVVNLASGQVWTATSAPLQDWEAVASSADGTKLVAAGGSDCAYSCSPPLPIYTSTDSGV